MYVKSLIFINTDAQSGHGLVKLNIFSVNRHFEIGGMFISLENEITAVKHWAFGFVKTGTGGVLSPFHIDSSGPGKQTLITLILLVYHI